MVKAVIAGLMLIAWARIASAHPLHTSLTQMSFDSSKGEVTISVRVFAVDFADAARVAKADPAAYALSKFKLTDSRGNGVVFVSCGGRRVGELLWLCFRGKAPNGIEGARVSCSVLFETYKDQINIVTAHTRQRTVNLLFTPGDRPKSIG